MDNEIKSGIDIIVNKIILKISNDKLPQIECGTDNDKDIGSYIRKLEISIYNINSEIYSVYIANIKYVINLLDKNFDGCIKNRSYIKLLLNDKIIELDICTLYKIVNNNFSEAIRTNDMTEIMKLNIEGADSDGHNMENIYHIVSAINNKRERVLKYLLVHGADPNNSKILESPLHLAVVHGSESMVRILLKYGANINSIYKEFTPLDYAFNEYDENIIILLAKKGGYRNQIDSDTDLDS